MTYSNPWRLLTILAALLAACGPDLALTEPEADLMSSNALAPGDVRLRLMGANISSGNYQSYSPGEGIRIFQGTHPDIVMIQEFNYGSNTTAEIRSFVDTAFGTSFQYYREGGAQIPNGVISRYPILASGEWYDSRVSNRDFAWARIDIPGPVDLWAISVHLLTTSTTERNLEAQLLVGYIQQNIPAGDYIAIGGDYNTGSRSESAISTLAQKVVTSSPYPADRNGNTNTNASRAKPYDWVLVSGGLDSKETPVVIGASTFTYGLVADTRVYSPISEISPALSTDSGAVNMQHMGVIRDFAIPSGDPVPSVTVTSPNGGESWTVSTTHNITWTSSNISNVKIEYTLNGTSWTVLTSSTSASSGSYSWTLPSTTSTSARVRVTDAAGTTSDTSNAAFTITAGGGGGGSGVVFINEILANEAGSDVNGEFVEIVNQTGAAVDLSGWTVSDGSSVRHTFAAGTSLQDGAAIVVFGGASGIPGGLTNAVAASTGTLSFGNGGDTVSLKSSTGATVDAFTYTSSLSGTDGVSMNRNPDATATGTMVLHTSISSLQRSPGTRADGSAFTGGGGGGGGSGSISSETESNDTATTANGPLGNNKNVSGSISTTSDADWFKVTVNTAATITISVSMPGSADLDWYLYSESNTSSYLTRGYTTANPETGSYAASAGVYYVKVVGYAGATSSYTLNVSGPAGSIDP